MTNDNYAWKTDDITEPGSGVAVNRVFILAELDYYVEGLSHVISSDENNIITACVKPGDGCWNRFLDTRPDILLVHHRAVMTPAAAFFARFKQAVPGVRILVFGHELERAFLHRIIRAGADGYINEKMSGEQVRRALHSVRAGEIWAEREVLSEFARSAVELEEMIEAIIQRKIEGLGDTLSRREVDVFQLVLKGLSTKEIADELALSQQSVKLYLGRVFKKFDVTNRAQLILMAFEQVCPVSNMIRLFRMTLDKRRLRQGKAPHIPDPLEEQLLGAVSAT
ncbi:MAG: response regulator transcription factor [Gammaproteobacteria bacterium]|nr:response regulator transcription factor [Gammaproteobacteria bacterium]